MTQKPISRSVIILFWLSICLLFGYLIHRGLHLGQGGIKESIVTDKYRRIIIKADGYHYYRFIGKINGYPTTFLVDTGANRLTIPSALAKKMKLMPEKQISVDTVNGRVIGHLATVRKIELGPIVLMNRPAVIVPDKSNYVLLGMSVLKDLEFYQKDGYLILHQNTN